MTGKRKHGPFQLLGHHKSPKYELLNQSAAEPHTRCVQSTPRRGQHAGLPFHQALMMTTRSLAFSAKNALQADPIQQL